MRFVPGGVRQVWRRDGRENGERLEAVRMFQTAKETGISDVSFPSWFLLSSSALLLDGTVMTFRKLLVLSKCAHPETIWSCMQFQISFLWDSMSGIR